jgi:hypothetical protein
MVIKDNGKTSMENRCTVILGKPLFTWTSFIYMSEAKFTGNSCKDVLPQIEQFMPKKRLREPIDARHLFLFHSFFEVGCNFDRGWFDAPLSINQGE